MLSKFKEKYDEPSSAPTSAATAPEQVAPVAAAPSVSVKTEPVDLHGMSREDLIALLHGPSTGAAATPAKDVQPSIAKVDNAVPPSTAKSFVVAKAEHAQPGETDIKVPPGKLSDHLSVPADHDGAHDGDRVGSTVPLKLPEGVHESSWASRSARAKDWAQYVRTVNVSPHAASPKERGNRSEKCPLSIRNKIVGIHERNYYFQLWMGHNKSWASVKGFEEHYEEVRKGRMLNWAWLMDCEMREIWKDPEIVDGLQEEAKNDLMETRHRHHPRIPHISSANQFKVVIEDHMSEKYEACTKKGIKMDFDLDVCGDAADTLVNQHLQRSMRMAGMSEGATTAPHASSMTSPPQCSLLFAIVYISPI